MWNLSFSIQCFRKKKNFICPVKKYSSTFFVMTQTYFGYTYFVFWQLGTYINCIFHKNYFIPSQNYRYPKIRTFSVFLRFFRGFFIWKFILLSLSKYHLYKVPSVSNLHKNPIYYINIALKTTSVKNVFFF